MYPPGTPMRLMTRAEKIAEFQRRIDDVTAAEAATGHGKAYLALTRALLRQVEASPEACK
jgi:hypothetical protein